MNSNNVIKATALVACGILTGSNAAFSFAWAPTLTVAAPEDITLAQWRYGFLVGYKAVRIQVPAATIPWIYLACCTTSTISRSLYLVAAALPVSSILYTVTVLKPTLGALCWRAEKLIGPASGEVAVELPLKDQNAIELERKASTKELIHMWAMHNWFRAGLASASALAGGWAIVLGS